MTKLSSRPNQATCAHSPDRLIKRAFGLRPGKAGVMAKPIYQTYCLDCGAKIGKAT